MHSVPFRLLLISCLVCLSSGVGYAANMTIDFESYPVPTDSYLNNLGQASGVTEEFVVDGIALPNFWDTTFGDYWEGWSLSTVTTLVFDGPDLAGFDNQYASATASGSGGSETYAIAFTNGFSTGDSYINLVPGTAPVSVDITNTAWAYSSMLYGDGFAKQFSADDNDFFLLEITGHSGADKTGSTVGTIDVYLSQTQLDQLTFLTDWETVDLLSLTGSQSLSFHLSSSDNSFGFMNTPAYFALDDFVFSTSSSTNPAPEPATSLMLLGGAILLGHRRRNR